MLARAAVITIIAALGLSWQPNAAFAQKQGGTLRIYHRDNPPSASILEEATYSVNLPFMAVFNNLVLFDPRKTHETIDGIVPDLGKSWSWDATNTKLTFQLEPGVKWHDGKPFTAKDVQCTWHMLIGKAGSEDFRKNPRGIWYHNLKEVTVNGDTEATFVLNEPQPSFLAILASGYSPIYPCHVPQREMRTKPVGTGPFKFVEFKRNESIRLVRNPDYWKKGLPYLDAIDVRIIDNRSTRILAFVAGEFDMTFGADITVPLLKDLQKQAPNAVCPLLPTGVTSNLIVNSSAAPFDNPKLRRAMALAIDRSAFNTILSEGKSGIGGAMLPAELGGSWGMPKEELAKLPGYGDPAKDQAEARQIMTQLGYSAEKPLKLKLSSRNIAVYRDPAVILIDQFKKIFIDAELEVVDSTIWHAKVQRKDYAAGGNLTGVAIDDPDVNLVENYSCKSDRNYTQYCNKEVDKLIFEQSKITDLAKRKRMVWDIERSLAEDVARPIILHDVQATCWHPHVKNFVMHDNVYNVWRFEQVWLDK